MMCNIREMHAGWDDAAQLTETAPILRNMSHRLTLKPTVNDRASAAVLYQLHYLGFAGSGVMLFISA